MQSIRRQIANEIKKGTVQRVGLSTKGGVSSHKLEDTNKSKNTSHKPKEISPCTKLASNKSETASLENFDLRKHNSHST